jgi:hypothetical protein
MSGHVARRSGARIRLPRSGGSCRRTRSLSGALTRSRSAERSRSRSARASSGKSSRSSCGTRGRRGLSRSRCRSRRSSSLCALCRGCSGDSRTPVRGRHPQVVGARLASGRPRFPERVGASATACSRRARRRARARSPTTASSSSSPSSTASKEAVETGRKFCLHEAGADRRLGDRAQRARVGQTFHPGPTLYMTSTDDVAKEFSRDRLSFMCETCEPLARKFLPARGLRTRSTCGSSTGRSRSAAASRSTELPVHPYRNVFIDEADSLAELAGAGDPVKLADLRSRPTRSSGARSSGRSRTRARRRDRSGDLYYGRVGPAARVRRRARTAATASSGSRGST